MEDRIEREIELKAPVARVWKAITDHEEFGQWFQVALEAPFAVGEISRGQITHPGCEHMKWVAHVTKMEHERLFAYTWCPYSDVASRDTSNEPQTLVEFKLEPTETGTRLVISESGFSALPDDPRRVDAMRQNSGGWDAQIKNIAAHVE